MINKLTFSRRSFILMSLSLAACKGGSDILEFSGSTMGTKYSVTAVDHDGSVDKVALNKAIEKSLLEVNALMSNWDAKSEVSRFNAMNSTAPVQVSDALASVVKASKDINLASDGQFDITLGPVIEAWGFGAKNAGFGEAPEADIVAAAMQTAGQMDELTVDGNMLSKSNPGLEIFLPSIGKGYGVDKVAEVVKGFGLRDFMVEIGGDIYVSGQNRDGMDWQIGIETPDARTREAYQIASVSNLGMATSGDYRNFYERDGQRYSHIIDAKTGRPITHNTASVTVLAENAMLADAWATALLVVGTKRGLEIANQQNLAVLFMDRGESEGFTTSASTKFAALQA
ncbi:thiamine biosynthesis lipoprotein ApbE [Roseibium sp. TrichSKD4]|uniref:FAD:protein FMN transferase n=1 Tax=Roseibium sp. TrichSKD4 TaxID=744980 RepID=UPI0001E56600|nr:FAD:protein FMN transferase [Roseibium sp. TrichSKD4]EFO33549.1 thiamine biosynthesis lipoprotein ApbE [Roseibium sp. TrichSKD4]